MIVPLLETWGWIKILYWKSDNSCCSIVTYNSQQLNKSVHKNSAGISEKVESLFSSKKIRVLPYCGWASSACASRFCTFKVAEEKEDGWEYMGETCGQDFKVTPVTSANTRASCMVLLTARGKGVPCETEMKEKQFGWTASQSLIQRYPSIHMYRYILYVYLYLT